MAGTELVTLAAAVIAFLGSGLSLYISTRLAVQKERRQLLWSKELDRFFELEQLAGELVEELGSYRPIPEDRTSLERRFQALELAAGRSGDIQECGRMFAVATGIHADRQFTVR